MDELKFNYISGPLYVQVYEEIKRRILNKTYSVGKLIPSEASLQQEFGVSRITIRRALDDLVNDGFIYKRQGVGAVVLSTNQYEDTFKLNSFTEDVILQGKNPSSSVLKQEVVEASVEVAEKLQIKPGKGVFFLKRLRLIDGSIAGLHETYISMRFGLDFTDKVFDEKASLYKFYEENNVILGTAEETIEAIIPSERLRWELFMEENEPLMFRKRISYDEQKCPIEYSKNYYFAKLYKYVISLKK